MIRIDTYEDLLQAIIDYNIPIEIAMDVMYRILSWVESGGYLNDNYISRQYRYIERYIKELIEKEIQLEDK